MSLPNYLAKIKSAGIYRFTWDKSVVPPQQAETLRLLVGYSEKGPFNTPVYIDNVADFKSIYGNISKKLERKGIYFHRLAEQALQAGPILALNLKPFTEAEKVNYANFAGTTIAASDADLKDFPVKSLYDTNRFWNLDADKMVENLGDDAQNYVTLAITDTKDASCTVVMRPVINKAYVGITLRSWCATQGIEPVGYMEHILDQDLSTLFADIYVFKGEFANPLIKHVMKRDDEGKETTEVDWAASGVLAKYFTSDGKILATYTNSMNKNIDGLDALASDANSNFVGAYSGCMLPYFKDANGNYISLDLKFNADHTKHKMMMKLNLDTLDNAETDEDVLGYLKTVTDVTTITSYDYHYFAGYTYTGTASANWDKCKEVLSYPGIYEALTNRVDVEYHYIIDTFDTKNTETKAELFALAKAKDNAFAIINFPKMSQFTGDYAVEGADGGFSMEETMKKYSLPGDSEGASFGAYYTQLVFSDGTVKTVVPSAALVSNNFMQKWGPRQPYYIVAGPNYGALSYSGLVGPDYNFGRSDLDVLEPKGVNAIIYVPRLGTYISSNQTAKQIPVSGLSKVHIRELVIYLQNEVEHLLQSYQWEMNTQALRDTIKAKADAICEKIMNNGGIYAFVNVCDETNNTPEVIDNEMIILDTEIEPARGAGKMVHQLTIHKTGGLTSSTK